MRFKDEGSETIDIAPTMIYEVAEDGEGACFRAPSFDAEGFLGADFLGFSGSRCNIFFRLLRIDLENFSAMTDPTRGLGAPFYYIGCK